MLLLIYEERVRKRQLKKLKQFTDVSQQPTTVKNKEKGKSRDLVAKKVHVGSKKLQKAKKIEKVAKI